MTHTRAINNLKRVQEEIETVWQKMGNTNRDIIKEYDEKGNTDYFYELVSRHITLSDTYWSLLKQLYGIVCRLAKALGLKLKNPRKKKFIHADSLAGELLFFIETGYKTDLYFY